MNKRVKKLWIADLRSGEIEQAQHRLRDSDDGRCCLGVLCDVFKRETGKGAWRHDKDGDWVFAVAGQRDGSTLPEPVWKWAGMSDDNPLLTKTVTPASLNDTGHDFNYIADRIEKYL